MLFLEGFRGDVLRVVWDRESGVMIVQIVKDFGFHPGTVGKWMCVERVEAGRQSGVMTSEVVQLWELRRGNRLLEQENGVFRKAGVYLSSANLRGKLMYPLVADHLGQQLMEHVREELWCRNEKKPDPCGS